MEENKKAGLTPGGRTRKFIGKSSKKPTNGSEIPSIEDSVSSNAITVHKNIRAGARGTYAGAKINLIPDHIMNNSELAEAVKLLPSNYNFEIQKTIWQIEKNNSKRVALQFPEGLLVYSLIISDILEKFANVEIVIMGDVTYGACCIDDFSAVALGCDFMVHYGHSCLIPVNVTKIKTMYVFVEIGINTQHFVDTIKLNFESGTRICLVGVVQFLSSLHFVKKELENEYTITIPQVKPLSPGEILGCTSPKLTNIDTIVFLGDGRFHLESILIHNPDIPAYAYDPYSRKFTREKYDHDEMFSLRMAAIATAKKANKFGLILGTLGRQGSPQVLLDLEERLRSMNKEFVVVLLSEIFPQKLNLFKDVDCWVQIACPRLSIDWGYAFNKPLLSPYEVSVALGTVEWQSVYPMDFYANDSLGSYTPNHGKSIPRKTKVQP
ncbi:hypothetical protein BB559_001752 [Furculomyces boomerangus]|uniref:2-(3-amino-3-carboxypropyl)histidine synthase subunit 1 n=2 Tax=Harpellales TaxID=61421 RepID=A0A2T9Z0V4_9FUNG|nr:hypothetical protein BB559_001752 [Furculomyces boomerangus]PWA00831.1 hypothetical protein BB558_003108 [Smittium angustum]